MSTDFVEWNSLKQKIDSYIHKPPLVSEGEIWWTSVGRNVGSEINGKNDLFSRPVIIFRKLAHSFYFTIPTTTQLRHGSWYVEFLHKGKSMAACLQHARAIDHRRLSSKLGTLDDADYEKIKEGFKALYIK